MIKLTKDQFLQVGKEIMEDPRCDDDVKAAVRAAVSGEEIDGYFNFYTGSDVSKKNEWYDLIAINAAA